MMPNIRDWAIEYRRLGWSVFPLVFGHKFPPKGFALKRCFEQLPTESEIIAWWKQWPDSNVGLATGKVSGVDVIDFDGLNALDAYEANIGEFIETIMQTTGRANTGFHALYRYHGGGLKSKKYLESNGGGVDLKTDGGLVVLAPSVHKSGTSYKWAINPISDGLNDLADFPHDALEHFQQQCTEHRKLDPAELHIKGISDGRKHHDGFRYACRLRTLGLCFDEALVLLEHVFSVCNPPPRDGIKKAAFDRVMAAWGKFEPGRQAGDPRQNETRKIRIRPEFN
jgi:hypothetical protein